MQWYLYVPGVENWWEKVAPWARQFAGGHKPLPESKAPVSEVTLCIVESWLTQVTVDPAGTVAVAGWKLKFMIETDVAAPAVVAGSRTTPRPRPRPLKATRAATARDADVFLTPLLRRRQANGLSVAGIDRRALFDKRRHRLSEVVRGEEGRVPDGDVVETLLDAAVGVRGQDRLGTHHHEW